MVIVKPGTILSLVNLDVLSLPSVKVNYPLRLGKHSFASWQLHSGVDAVFVDAVFE
jgi:hypothetical protein